MRRQPSRVALAMVWIFRHGPDGAQPESALKTQNLAERVRTAARDTDTVVQLAPGWLALLAADPVEGGEVAMARRVLAVLNGRQGGQHSVVTVAVLEVADPDADPDAVIAHLERTAAPAAMEGGLVVLDAWPTGGTGQSEDAGAPRAPAADREHIRRALESGRFVLGSRPVLPLTGTPSPGGRRPLPGAHSPTTLLEVSTVDEGRLTPVRVSAPGLAAALDSWALEQIGVLEVDTTSLTVRLQPGGTLGATLGDDVASLLARRPGLELVLQVPEERLAEAVAADRAVLRRLASAGVGLGVSGWSGRIDVRTLVRRRVGLVELSPQTQQEVSRPDGAALVTGLVAGLTAGLGPHVHVVADDPQETTVTSRLISCGVEWAASSSARMMRGR
jgi:hypothetical protein